MYKPEWLSIPQYVKISFIRGVSIKMPSSFLATKLPCFQFLRVRSVAKPAGMSRAPGGRVAEPASRFFHSTSGLGSPWWPGHALACWLAGSRRKGHAFVQLPFLLEPSFDLLGQTAAVSCWKWFSFYIFSCGCTHTHIHTPCLPFCLWNWWTGWRPVLQGHQGTPCCAGVLGRLAGYLGNVYIAFLAFIVQPVL